MADIKEGISGLQEKTGMCDYGNSITEEYSMCVFGMTTDIGPVHLPSTCHVVLHVAVLVHCLPASFLKKSLHRILVLPAVLFPIHGSHMLTWPPHFHFSR
ncbi:uncharacterized protein [Periplaneta americana]|uniref:uncharacterized protein isoform X2 n=1 Tax=Periplaneta americana TaxID=6978 RepID=UPI0037E727D0